MKKLVLRSIIAFAFTLTAACSSAGGDGAVNAGVGQVCAASGDCSSGLSCREDTTDWIAHHECTASCSSDADCTGRFGSHTMCIGANICVSKCLDDKDCPAKTRCSENGWCANDGPGSGVPKCSGFPSSCESLGDTDCAQALGCNLGGTCGGVAESCSSQDEFSCNGTHGCYWDGHSCSGSTSPCSYNATQYTCGDQTGCRWTASCTGKQVATTCESQDALLCKYALGCSLVPQ